MTRNVTPFDVGWEWLTGTWSLAPVDWREGFASLVLTFDHELADVTGLIIYLDRDSKGIQIFLWLDEEGGDRLDFRR